MRSPPPHKQCGKHAAAGSGPHQSSVLGGDQGCDENNAEQSGVGTGSWQRDLPQHRPVLGMPSPWSQVVSDNMASALSTADRMTAHTCFPGVSAATRPSAHGRPCCQRSVVAHSHQQAAWCANRRTAALSLAPLLFPAAGELLQIAASPWLCWRRSRGTEHLQLCIQHRPAAPKHMAMADCSCAV